GEGPMTTRAAPTTPPYLPIPVSATVGHAWLCPHRALAAQPQRPSPSPRAWNAEGPQEGCTATFVLRFQRFMALLIPSVNSSIEHGMPLVAGALSCLHFVYNGVGIRPTRLRRRLGRHRECRSWTLEVFSHESCQRSFEIREDRGWHRRIVV